MGIYHIFCTNKQYIPVNWNDDKQPFFSCFYLKTIMILHIILPHSHSSTHEIPCIIWTYTSKIHLLLSSIWYLRITYASWSTLFLWLQMDFLLLHFETFQPLQEMAELLIQADSRSTDNWTGFLYQKRWQVSNSRATAPERS